MHYQKFIYKVSQGKQIELALPRMKKTFSVYFSCIFGLLIIIRLVELGSKTIFWVLLRTYLRAGFCCSCRMLSSEFLSRKEIPRFMLIIDFPCFRKMPSSWCLQFAVLVLRIQILFEPHAGKSRIDQYGSQHCYRMRLARPHHQEVRASMEQVYCFCCCGRRDDHDHGDDGANFFCNLMVENTSTKIDAS